LFFTIAKPIVIWGYSVVFLVTKLAKMENNNAIHFFVLTASYV